MKNVFLLLLLLCFSIYTNSQEVRINRAKPDTLKVLLTEDGAMSVIYKNHPLTINTTTALDSLIKTIPNLKTLSIKFESINADPEKKKTIDEVLKQCNCEIIRASQSFKKW